VGIALAIRVLRAGIDRTPLLIVGVPAVLILGVYVLGLGFMKALAARALVDPGFGF